MILRVCLVFLISVPLLAQKKPVTVEALTSMRPRGAMAGAPIWSPDGKSFAFQQGDTVMRYDIAAKQSQELLVLKPLAEAAVKPHAAERFDWENRGVHEEPIQWMPSGQDLLIAAGRDLFLWHIASRKFEQLTATAAEERDPKPSPDGRYVAFRRNHDLYVLELASHKETRLTTGGSDTLRNGAPAWVYPEELALGTAYWWSPDSRMIAYAETDHEGVEIWHVQLGQTVEKSVFRIDLTKLKARNSPAQR